MRSAWMSADRWRNINRDGEKVFDKQREQEKIAGVKALTHNDFNSHGVEELFEQIMSMSRKLQYQLLAAHGSEGRLPFIGVEELETDCARVVYQGAEGSYSQAAMRKFLARMSMHSMWKLSGMP